MRGYVDRIFPKGKMRFLHSDEKESDLPVCARRPACAQFRREESSMKSTGKFKEWILALWLVCALLTAALSTIAVERDYKADGARRMTRASARMMAYRETSEGIR